MTGPAEQPTPPAGAVELAEELALLTMLQDRVKAEIAARRETISATWTGGMSVPVTLPNPDAPARPVKVATIRADGGGGLARISDRPAWEAWCRDNVRHNVTDQPASRLSWALEPRSRSAIAWALVAAGEESARGFSADPVAMFLEALEGEGYTLTRSDPIPARTVIAPAWETGTLEATQRTGMPCTPDGQIPDGVEFEAAAVPVRPVVSVGKDEAVREQYVTAHRARLAQITGRIAPTQED